MICGSCDGPPYALPVALDRRHGEKLAKETKLFACLTIARHDPLTSASFLAVYSCITVTVTATISKPLRQATCLFSAPTSCSFLSHFQEGGVCGVRGAENVEECMCVSEGLLKQHLVATTVVWPTPSATPFLYLQEEQQLGVHLSRFFMLSLLSRGSCLILAARQMQINLSPRYLWAWQDLHWHSIKN